MPTVDADELLQRANEAECSGDFRACLDLALAAEEALDREGAPASDARRGHVGLLAGWQLRMLGHTEEAVQRAQTLAAAAHAHANWQTVLAGTLRLLGVLHTRLGDARAAELELRQARSLYVAMGDRAGEGRVCRELALLSDEIGAPGEAAGWLAAAFTCFGDDSPEVAQTLATEGDLRRIRGDLDGARGSFDRALARYEAIGHRYGVARCLDGLATVALAQGQFDEAIALGGRAIPLYEAIGYRQGQADAATVIGDALRSDGRLAEAEAAYRRALQLTGTPGTASGLVTRTNLALTLLARRDLVTARRELDSVVAEAEANGMRWLVGLCHVFLLPCDEDAGDVDGWHRHYARAMALLEETGVVDRDAGWAAELTATMARTRASTLRGRARSAAWARAARAAALGLGQWQRLGLDEDAERCAAMLRGLAAVGAPVPLGPFEVLRELGRGSTGEVFLARHRAQAVEVAVKVLTAGEDAEVQRAALLDEVRAVARLSHPYVIGVLDQGLVGTAAESMSGGRLRADSAWFVMELAEAGTLEDVCGRWTWSSCRTVLLQLLDALAHAHARGVVHLDVKPANVLLTEGGSPRLTDFGLAGALARLGDRRAVMGTPTTMAPEQFIGEPRTFGPWTDLYALGCLAAELVTGRHLFLGESFEDYRALHTTGQRPPLRPVVTVPRGFAAWLDRLLARDARLRFRRAADAAWALRQLPAVEAPPVHLADRSTLLRQTGPDTVALAAWDEHLPQSELASWSWADLPPVPLQWAHPEPEQPPLALLGAGLGMLALRTVPFTGRTRERSLLWAILREVVHGTTARVVVLEGGAGIGKTRLATWLAERAHELGVAETLVVRHAEQPAPGLGLRGAVLDLLQCHGLDRERAREHVAWRLALPGVGPDDLDPVIDGIVADGESGGPRYRAVLELLARLAAHRPVVVVLDDVQWGAEALALAQALVGAPYRVLCLCTVRDALTPARATEASALEALLDHDDVVPLTVEPLPADQQAALVRRLLWLREDLVEAVVARTGGHPRFAIELVTDLVQRDLLTTGSTGFALRPGQALELPASLHEVWGRRIAEVVEGLGPWAEDALAVAAALGPMVADEEWDHACRLARCRPPPELLRRLVARRLAQPETGGWRFVHAVLPHVTLRLAEQRGRVRDLHRACAEMLESRRGDPRRIGAHHMGAGEPRRALRPLLEGSYQRMRLGDHAGASAVLDQRDVALQTGVVREQDPAFGEQWLARSTLAYTEARYGEARELVRRAVDAARRHGWSLIADALRQLGDVERLLGDFDEALAHYEESLGHVTTDDARGRALFGLGVMARAKGRLGEAQDLLDWALDAVQGRERAFEATILLARAAVDRARGDLVPARVRLERAMAIARARGAVTLLVDCHVALGEVARLSGDLDAAEALYREALTHAPLLEANRRELAELNLCVVDLARGRWDVAGRDLERMLVSLQERQRATLAVFALVMLTAVRVTGDDPLWRVHTRGVDGDLERTGFTDPDLVWAFELAARRAHELGRAERAAWCEMWAERQRAGVR